MVDWARPGAANGRCATFADDVEFCKALPVQAGVAAIPPSAFCEHKDRARTMARFAFCKKRATLDEAVRRLERWSGL
jgi:N-succinyldiaminopimelate aminotransferase